MTHPKGRAHLGFRRVARVLVREVQARPMAASLHGGRKTRETRPTQHCWVPVQGVAAWLSHCCAAGQRPVIADANTGQCRAQRIDTLAELVPRTGEWS